MIPTNSQNLPVTEAEEKCTRALDIVLSITEPNARRVALKSFITLFGGWVNMAAVEVGADVREMARRVIARAETELQKIPAIGLPFGGDN